jgi:hypothetical protein
MGADFSETSSRSSCDSDDDPEAALHPAGDDDDNDNVAPRFRLRRLPQGSQDAASALLPGVGSAMSVYVMMHRYRRTPSATGQGTNMGLIMLGR